MLECLWERIKKNKAIKIYLIAEWIKNIYIYIVWIVIRYTISQYFPKSYETSGRKIKLELDLSNYETKVDLKRVADVDTSYLAAK